MVRLNEISSRTYLNSASRLFVNLLDSEVHVGWYFYRQIIMHTCIAHTGPARYTCAECTTPVTQEADITHVVATCAPQHASV